MSTIACKNMTVGLLVIFLSFAGCRKKDSGVIENDNPESVTDSTIVQPEPVFVAPEPSTSSVVTPSTPVAAPVTSTVAPPEVKPVQIMLQTTQGDIVLELDQKAAPVTVANFLRYVKEGFYDGTIFHRVIDGFMIQGGGFTENMTEKKTHSEIINEAANGLKNQRGTIAMARTSLPHSATSQFYINHKDNTMLDYGTCPDGYGYTVFGKVIRGMEIVDAIATAPTVLQGGEKSLPVQPVSVKKASVVSGG